MNSQEKIKPWLFNVPTDGVCIDVGAFDGASTLPMAEAVGPNGIVFAIEPNPTSFDILKSSTEKSHIMSFNTVPMMTAIGDAAGEPATFMKYESLAESWLTRLGSFSSIFTYPLDMIVWQEIYSGTPIKQLNFVRINTNGWESDVLKSMKKIIKTYRPDILVTVNRCKLARQGLTESAIYDALAPHGYRWKITDPSLTMESPEYELFCTLK